MKYGELSYHYPDHIASGIYDAYIDSAPATQMIVIGMAYDLKTKEISTALNIWPRGINRKFKRFKDDIMERLYGDESTERDM
jgi:hypothetical protein